MFDPQKLLEQFLGSQSGDGNKGGVSPDLDIDAVVSGAATSEAAIEIYAASTLAIDPDDPAEQAYLACWRRA